MPLDMPLSEDEKKLYRAKLQWVTDHKIQINSLFYHAPAWRKQTQPKDEYHIYTKHA